MTEQLEKTCQKSMVSECILPAKKRCAQVFEKSSTSYWGGVCGVGGMCAGKIMFGKCKHPIAKIVPWKPLLVPAVE